jgi:hypothetical protein
MTLARFDSVYPWAQTFQLSKVDQDLLGFDPTVNPPWQMVPFEGFRWVSVFVTGESNWTVQSLNPRIATVTPYGEKGTRYSDTFRIDGKERGSTFIVVKDSKGQELGRLEVGVKRMRSPTIKFFLVKDKAGHKTSMSAKDVKDWLEYANWLLWYQINVRFVLDSVREITINEDLGDPIDFIDPGMMPFVPHRNEGDRKWHAITDHGDVAHGTLNVFCLWDFIYSKSTEQFDGMTQSKVRITADEMAHSGANLNMSIIKDNFDWPDHGRVLAHEAGHYLEGMPFHYDPSNGPIRPLMRGDGIIGERLLKRDANAMNKK